MKRFVSLAILLLVAASLSASVIGGDLQSVKVASTEHFDVIYKEVSLETASLLFDNCEDIYSSLVEYLGYDPKLHIPVVVTSEYKELNAYYSVYPANRIVMFDTVGDQGDLSNFRQTILYIFRHELTHAFHYNSRGPLFEGVAKLFGDIVINMALKICAVYLVIGVVDYVYQRHKFNEDLKMTKQEVKDEWKNSEGDPQIKGRQRQRMQEASRRRSS